MELPRNNSILRSKSPLIQPILTTSTSTSDNTTASHSQAYDQATTTTGDDDKDQRSREGDDDNDEQDRRRRDRINWLIENDKNGLVKLDQIIQVSSSPFDSVALLEVG